MQAGDADPRLWRVLREHPAVWVVLGLWLAVASYLALTLNLWRDEMYSLHTSGFSPGFAIENSLRFELQPPLYFLLLSLWRKISPAAEFARMLSVGFGFASLLVLAMISRRLFPARNPAWVPACLGFHPMFLWASSEIRVYALVILLACTLCLQWLRCYLGGSNWRHRATFVLLGTAAIYTQYYMVVLLGALGLGIALERGIRRSLTYFADMLLVGVACLPMLSFVLEQVGGYPVGLGQSLSAAQELRLLVLRFENQLFSLNQVMEQGLSSEWLRPVRWLQRGLLALALVWMVRCARTRTRPFTGESRAVVWGLLGCFALLWPLLAMVGPDNLVARYTISLLLPLWLAAFVVLDRNEDHRVFRAAAGFLLASNVLSSAWTQADLSKECDCSAVAEVLVESAEDAEPVLVFPSEDVLPLGHHYRGPARLVAVPKPPNLGRWDLGEFVLHSEAEARRVLEQARVGQGSLWVYTGEILGAFGIDYGRSHLEAVLARSFVERQRFEFAGGVLLRRFEPQLEAQRASATIVSSPPK